MAYNSRFYEASGYYGKASVAEYFANPGIRAKFDTLYRQLARIRGCTFSRSLDIGCGGSPFTRLLTCPQRVCVDLSLIALRGLKRENPVQADITHLPFRAASFPVIVGTDVLEHVPRDDLAAAEIGRITRAAGVVVLTVPHNPEMWSSTDAYEGHFRRYTKEALTKRLAAAGFLPKSAFKVYGVYLIMRAVQTRDRKKHHGQIIPRPATRQKKTPAEFLLSDFVNVLRLLTQNRFFFAIYNPISKLASRCIMLDARVLPFSKVCEIGIIAQKHGVS